jgi:hypothetical protein
MLVEAWKASAEKVHAMSLATISPTTRNSSHDGDLVTMRLASIKVTASLRLIFIMHNSWGDINEMESRWPSTPEKKTRYSQDFSLNLHCSFF